MYGYSALSSIEAGTRALSRRGGRYSDHAWPCRTGSSRHSPCREALSEERRAGNPQAAFCGSRRRVTASGHPVSRRNRHDNGHQPANVGCWGISGRGAEVVGTSASSQKAAGPSQLAPHGAIRKSATLHSPGGLRPSYRRRGRTQGIGKRLPHLQRSPSGLTEPLRLFRPLSPSSSALL